MRKLSTLEILISHAAAVGGLAPFLSPTWHLAYMVKNKQLAGQVRLVRSGLGLNISCKS